MEFEPKEIINLTRRVTNMRSYFSRNVLIAVIVASGFFPGIAIGKPDEAIIASLIRAGDAEVAYQKLKDSNPSIDDILFFRALLAQHRGQYDEALVLFNEVLIENPNHINARREIASTLFIQGRYRLAELSFQELVETDNTPNMQGIYESYIREIRARRPFSFSGHLSIVPSSNVNRGSENLIYSTTLGDFIIDPESRAKSGIGVRAGFLGVYRPPVRGNARNIISFGLNNTLYEEDIYNTATAHLRFTHQISVSGATRISPGLYGRYNWREDDADNRALGFSVSLLHAVNSKNRLSFAANYEKREYLHQSYNDGPFANINVDYSYLANPSLLYSLGLDVSRQEPNAEHFVYTGEGVSAGVRKEWSGGFITGVSVNVGSRDYEEDFPLAGVAREDDFYGVSFSVQNNDWIVNGFRPRVYCSYIETESNISFYESDVLECNFGIIRRF